MSNNTQTEQTAKERAEQIKKMRETHRPYDGKVSRFPQLPERQGFKTHWFNDEKGKIGIKLKEGWEFSKRAGFTDDKVDLEKNPNKRIKVRVGTQEDGSELNAFAMDLPLEIYEGDRERKTAAYRKRLEFIEKGGLDTQDSTLNAIGAKPQVNTNMHTTFNKQFKPD